MNTSARMIDQSTTSDLSHKEQPTSRYPQYLIANPHNRFRGMNHSNKHMIGNEPQPY
uniref:Uncharacterized protein n=1 Tax=Arion vulgaris TaxID=1028688 RepID=A0A0B6ZW10_9EUPU